MRGVFITGTDTGVGKTLVAAALAARLARQGLSVGVMKPLETGVALESTQMEGSDARLLRDSAGGGLPLESVCPLRYAHPLAPAVAARRLGEAVDLHPIYREFARIREASDVLLVEGCGGLLVPLSDTMDVADLALRLQLPLLIVARAGLGTINHTGLTIQAARQRGLTVRGVVLSGAEAEAGDTSPQDNAAQIARQFQVEVLAELPRFDITGDAASRVDALLRHWEHQPPDRLLAAVLQHAAA